LTNNWKKSIKHKICPISGTGLSEQDAEYFTIAGISLAKHRITIEETVEKIHLGYEDTEVVGSDFRQAAEVGLLSKNIKIDGSSGSDGKYGGRMLIAGSSFNTEVYRQGMYTIHIENVLNFLPWKISGQETFTF
jgi:hypothetical protein